MDIQNLPPIIVSELQPPMNITVIRGEEGLKELDQWILKKQAEEPVPTVGADTETNITVDFYHRKVRTIQIGDRDRQFVFDLLAFAGSEDVLSKSQGHYGKYNGDIYASIFTRLDPILCTNKWLKVGQNLSFEYEVFFWNFGRRIWNLYSTDLAERVIQAGTISLKNYSEFSMVSIVARHFKKRVNKEEQGTFDLHSELTQKQIEYAAFDSRIPIAIRQAQINIMTKDQLLTTAQIENDALGTYAEMHLYGQNLDDEKWLANTQKAIDDRAGQLRALDEVFLPIVGHKNNQIDEEKLQRLFDRWKNDFEKPTQEEMKLAEQKRNTKDPVKKLELKIQLEALVQERKDAKKKAREAHSELSKQKTKIKNTVPKCEGEAFLNYNSQPMLLHAFKKIRGMETIADTSDDTLLKHNDVPIIKIFRKYRKGRKLTGTYGVSWTKRWITKPCKEEGWRHPEDGKLHCKFNQLEAETGRSSSSSPNAQNLPAEKDVRSCFIADPADYLSPEGYELITIDLSGAELRIIAEMANATSWIQAFNAGQDVHSVCTEILYPDLWKMKALNNCAYYQQNKEGQAQKLKCSCPEHKEMRNKSKALNFGLCYGAGPDTLADQLDITTESAKELMSLHEKKFPDIWSFLRKLGEQAKEAKEARDMYGRRRVFMPPTWESARDWFIEYRSETLEIPKEYQDKNIFEFKVKNLREPNEEETWKLIHRYPNESEIKYGYRSMLGSINRRGMNMPIQGSNATMMKRAMSCGIDKNGIGYLWHLLPPLGAKIINMVHDELLIQARKSNSKEVAEVVKDAFLRAGAEVCSHIKMESEYHIGPCWEK